MARSRGKRVCFWVPERDYDLLRYVELLVRQREDDGEKTSTSTELCRLIRRSLDDVKTRDNHSA